MSLKMYYGTKCTNCGIKMGLFLIVERNDIVRCEFCSSAKFLSEAKSEWKKNKIKERERMMK